MSHKAKPSLWFSPRARSGPGRGHAESIIPALHATMRTMRAALAQIGEFAKGDGAQPDALDAAAKVVTLAKSIPSIFPPGSELTALPTKTGAPPTTWSDVERFLDAEAIGRQQAKSASSWRAQTELRYRLTSGATPIPQQLSVVTETIIAEPMLRLSQLELAHRLKMERTGALRMFKAATGLTFRRFKQ
jgi:cytochrome c556